MRGQISQGDAAIQLQSSSTGGGGHGASGVELVLEFADDLLQCVLRRHQPQRGTILIDHDGHLATTLLELLQQLEGRLRLRHDQQVAHDLPECQAGRSTVAHTEGDTAEVHQLGDVLGVDHTDEGIHALRRIVNGNP